MTSLRTPKPVRASCKGQYIAAGGEVQIRWCGTVFMGDGSKNKELKPRISKANTALRKLYRSVATKRELSNTTKLSVLIIFFFRSSPMVVNLGWWLKGCYLMYKQKRMNVCEKSTAWHCDKVCSCKIRKSLNVEPLFRIERPQLWWFGSVTRMSQKRIARQVLLATPTWKRPRGRPKTKWHDHFSNLGSFSLGVKP